METRTCLNCDTIIDENSQRRKFCSGECHQEFLYKERHKKDTEGKVCPQCLSNFTPQIRSQKFCTAVCRTEYYDNIRTKTANVKICPYCEESYKSKKVHAETCDRRNAFSLQEHTESRLSAIPMICTVCGEKFIPTHGNQKFCSSKCSAENYDKLHTVSEVKIKKCIQCNLIFKSAEPLQFFCSDECHDKHLKNTPTFSVKSKICPNCKKTFETRNNKIKFCSLQCQTYFKHKKTVKKGWPGKKYR